MILRKVAGQGVVPRAAGALYGVEGARALTGASPAGAGVFGSLGHRFSLDEPLTSADVADLEAQIGVVLPEEYREFPRQVGAGAGPAYGIFPVRRIQGRWRWEGDGADLAALSRLAEPFPRQGPDPEQVRAILEERPEEEDFRNGGTLDVGAMKRRWPSRSYPAGPLS